MNCKAVRTTVLGLEQLDQPPPDAAGHLADCGACRDWLRRLTQMERCVSQLPVPASAAKSAVIARILSEPRPRPAAPEPLWVQRERRLKRLAVAAAMSAALVLIAVGMLVWQHANRTQTNVVERPKPPPAEETLLAGLMKNNLNLASAKTSRQRVEALADVAENLQSELRSLIDVANPEDLTALARLYERVMRQGIVPQAKTIPAAERALLLGPLADRLAQVQDEADQLAAQLANHRPAVARPLRDLAAAARDGDRQLRILLRGENL